MQHEYRVTFPQRFRRENHPRFIKAHPDGWVTIVASSEGLARDLAFHVFGEGWAFIYGPDDPGRPTEELYPLGERARINENDYGDEEEDG